MKQIVMILLLNKLKIIVGEYKSYLWFNVDGQTYGDKIIITFKIIEKKNKTRKITLKKNI